MPKAIATGPGIGAWFVPSTVEERVGRRVTFDLGDGLAVAGVVTGWDPPPAEDASTQGLIEFFRARHRG